MYPDPRVVEVLSSSFVPVKIHVKEQPQVFDRFNAHWTPILLVLDADGVEQHRFEGYLPVPDFLAQLELGLGKTAFAHKDFAGAERRFRKVCEEYAQAGGAPEGCYWAGVSEYKRTNDASALKRIATLLRERFPENEWARKASVWIER